MLLLLLAIDILWLCHFMSALDHAPRQVPSGFVLSQEDVDEFKHIVERTSGLAMDDQTAWNRAIEILNLFRILIGPIPEDPEVRAVVDGSNVVRLDV